MERLYKIIFLVTFIILLLVATQIKTTSHPVGGCYQTEMGHLCVDGQEYGVAFGWPVELFSVGVSSIIHLSFMIVRLASYALLLLVPLIFAIVLLTVRSRKNKNHRR